MDVDCVAPEYFRVDDLLDFPNDDDLSHASTGNVTFAAPPSSSATTSDSGSRLVPSSENLHSGSISISPIHFSLADDFTNNLRIPAEDEAELEWLSRFVDDTFSDFPSTELTSLEPDMSAHSEPSPSKRSKATFAGKPKSKKEDGGGEARRCAHCESEKTPQWRTGPLGPKTLCNACGVRYKSGRLVPEYRPAASPTFVLSQHSNSHRKVLELRRQKEL